jgi:hypothetical protein
MYSLLGPHQAPTLVGQSSVKNNTLYLFGTEISRRNEVDMGDFIVLMEAVHTSEASIYLNGTTRCYIPKSCHLQVDMWFIALTSSRAQLSVSCLF